MAVAPSAQLDGDLVARRLIELRRRAVLERRKDPVQSKRVFFRDYHGNVYFFRSESGQAALRIQLPTRAGEEPAEEAKAPIEWRRNQAGIWESRYNINLLKIATVPNHRFYNKLRVRNDFGVRDVDQYLCNRLQVPFLEVKPTDTVLHPTSDLYARLLTMYRAMTLHGEENGGYWRVKRADNGVHMAPFLESHHAAVMYHPMLERCVIFLVEGKWTGGSERRDLEKTAAVALLSAESRYGTGRAFYEGAARDVEQVFAGGNCVMMTFPPCEYGIATLYAKHKGERYALEVGGIFLSQDNVDHWVSQDRVSKCPCCLASRVKNKTKCLVHKGNVPAKAVARA